MQEKTVITSNFIGLKIFAGILLVAGPYIFFIQDKEPLLHAVVGTLVIWGIAALLLLFVRTRNQIAYDGAQFYISNWKGKLLDIVPNQAITSMLFSGFSPGTEGSAHRFFYNAADGTKKEFWLFPNSRINTWQLQKKLKQINPGLITTRMSFGGIEHLFFRNEDWFK